MTETTEPTAAPPPAILYGYKGHDGDLKCRGVQFEVGKTYEIAAGDAPVRCGAVGCHWCSNPFDVWTYYGPANSRFTRVRAEGPHAMGEGDTKVASAKIAIEAEISLPDFIAAAIDWVVAATKGKSDSGYSARGSLSLATFEGLSRDLGAGVCARIVYEDLAAAVAAIKGAFAPG